jgi:hypothetical protein
LLDSYSDPVRSRFSASARINRRWPILIVCKSPDAIIL